MDAKPPAACGLAAAPVERRLELAARCSLTPRSALVFMATISITTLAVAAPFARSGFWPILVFALLELAVLTWALRASMRSGRRRETITVTQESVTIAHRGLEGETRVVFPRHWSRVTLDAPAAALHPSRLLIESYGRACEVGRFLTEDERRRLAVRLKQLVGEVNESPAL
ncbi:MAG: DUF2244 domain-containing protein [Steroidobacteraceae bacterium]|jgi:uncharacterized membrane protein|nr:DUF2244 domain-containing protein [Steroidobacteraceae bacterium]